MEYTTVAKKKDEYSMREAARRLGVHQVTVREWVKDALTDGESRLAKGAVRKDLVGRYYVKKAEVARLLEQHGKSEAAQSSSLGPLFDKHDIGSI